MAQHIRAWTREAHVSDALLYLAGEDRSGNLAGDLLADGLTVVTAAVYRAVKADAFPPAVAAALAAGQLDGVLHFSRRSAQAYVDCARAGGHFDQAMTPTHFCLSDQIAEPLTAAGARTVRIAARPDEAALIALIGSGG
jgi:uroporphyrinogen-III synthase